MRVPLFDRQDRRLRPTPYALAYVERARRMVFDENEGARSLALMRDGELGSLSFGMGSSIAQFLLGAADAGDAGRRRRACASSAMVQSTDVLHAALLTEQLDFFIGDVRIAAARPRHGDRAALSLHLRLVRARRASAGGEAQGHDGRPRAYPLIAAGYADEAVERRIADLYGLDLPISKHFALSTSDLATVHALLASSDAIAPSTDIAVLDPLRAGVVVPIDVTPALDLELTLGIVHRAGRTLVPAASRAFDFVRASFANAAGEIARLDGRGHGLEAGAGKHRPVRRR